MPVWCAHGAQQGLKLGSPTPCDWRVQSACKLGEAPCASQVAELATAGSERGAGCMLGGRWKVARRKASIYVRCKLRQCT